MKAEMLEPDVEYNLAVAWRDKRDEKALDRLIRAYTVSYTHLTLPTKA